MEFCQEIPGAGGYNLRYIYVGSYHPGNFTAQQYASCRPANTLESGKGDSGSYCHDKPATNADT